MKCSITKITTDSFVEVHSKKPELTEGRIRVIEEAHNLGIDCQTWKDLQYYRNEVHTVLSVNKESEKILKTWKNAFNDVLNIENDCEELSDSNAEHLDRVPHHSRDWKSIIAVEHNVKLYWVNEARFYKDPHSGETRNTRNVLTHSMMKRFCLDIMWDAAVAMYVRNTYLKKPVWFSSDSVGKTCWQLAFDCADTDMLIQDSRMYICNLVGKTMKECWKFIIAPLEGDSSRCNRLWLGGVAKLLNDTHHSRETYSAEENNDGNCVVELRSVLFSEALDILMKNPDWNYKKQRRELDKMMCSHPELKESAYNWLINSLREVVNEETGEMLMKPYSYSERKIDYSKIRKEKKDFSKELIKTVDGIRYFPKKFCTNANFRKWLKEEHSDWKCKFMEV